MYAENDELHIEKGFMDFDSFYKAYKPHQKKPMAIHFRITTHGETDEENTHPFRVGKNLAFIHNGIISNVDCSTDKTRSDTYHFNTKLLSPIYKRDSRFIYKEHFKDLIRSYIGHSKLVFLNNKGHHTIVNEKMGVWDEGVWYSNTSYRPYKVTQPAVNTNKRIHPYKPVTTFKQGSRVTITHSVLGGAGVIEYFSGGVMVGVLRDGDLTPSLVPMACIALEEKQYKFVVGDWVVRNGQNTIMIVSAITKDKVWVQHLDDETLDATGVTMCISEDKLNLWVGY